VAYLIGGMIGGVVAVFLFSMLLEWAIFRRVMGEGEGTVIVSVAVTAFLAVCIYTLGGNGFTHAMMVYGFGALVTAPVRVRAYREKQRRAELAETFE
jgi:hypothetical protein